MNVLVIGSNGGVGAAIAALLIKQKYTVDGATLSGKDKYQIGYNPLQVNVLNGDEFALLPKYDVVFGAFNASQYSPVSWENEFNKFINNFITYGQKYGSRLVFIDNMYGYKLSANTAVNEETKVQPVSELGRIRASVLQKFLQACHNGLNGIVVQGSDLIGPYALNSLAGERFYTQLLNKNIAEVLPFTQMTHPYTYTMDFAACAIDSAFSEKVMPGQIVLAPAYTNISFTELALATIKYANPQAKIQNVPLIILRVMGLFTPAIKSLLSMSYEWKHPYSVDNSKYLTINPNFKPRSLESIIKDSSDWFKSYLKDDNNKA